MSKRIRVFVLFTFSWTLLSAQNSHYWTQQYGNKSLLLGGAVAGSVSDLGSVYYNPGFLALSENPAFVVTAKLLQFTNISIEDGLGDNIDLKRNRFGSAPGLIAGVFNLKFLPKSKFAYSYLTRRTFDMDFIYRSQLNVDVLPNNPGNEDFTGEIGIINKSAEYWGGWTWSYPLSDHMSIGLSNYFTITTYQSVLNIDLAARALDNHVVALSRRRQHDYNNFAMLFKVGYAIKYPNFTAGISITTPKFKVAGSGFMFSKSTISGADSSYINTNEDFFESDYQENLPSKLKSPFSVAIGAGYTINKLTLHISGEWFDKIDKYTIMQAEPFIGQTNGKTISTSIAEDLSTVINAGIAVEYRFGKIYQFYGGFSTDFSAAATEPALFIESNREYENSTFRGDIFHFSGGLGLHLKIIDITVGMSYNYGIDQIGRPVNLPGNGDGPIFDSDETATLKISTWKMLLGFALPVASNKSN